MKRASGRRNFLEELATANKKWAGPNNCSDSPNTGGEKAQVWSGVLGEARAFYMEVTPNLFVSWLGL